MTIRTYIVGMFCPPTPTEEIEEVQQAAQQHARLLAGAYVESFEQETRRIMAASCARFTGHTTNGDDTPPCIEASPSDDDGFKMAETYADMTRPELFKECRQKEIHTARTDTIEDLVRKLCEE